LLYYSQELKQLIKPHQVHDCDRTTSGRGSSPGSTWAILGEARTQSTHISTISYIEVQVKVITAFVHVLIIQRRIEAKITLQKDKSEFAEVISLNGQNILFAQKENVIHRYSKLEDPSTESNPHRFGPPTNNPRRQEETIPHLHTKDIKSKAWVTMLKKTYPRWSKDHL
jgi:hypothetical protein